MLQRYKPFLPVVFLAGCSFVTLVTAIQGNIIIAGESFDFAPNEKHYGGMVAIGLAALAFFRFRPFYKFVVAAIFLQGMFRIISFTPMDYSIGFGPEDARLQLDIIALAFGLLVYWTHATKINTAVFAFLKPSEEQIRKTELAEIEDFKEKFSRKTPEELAQIVTANALIPSALTAARQLLKERQ